MALGVRDKFSWNAVALAAIGGGLGAGGGKLGVGGNNWGSVAARAMVRSALTQGIGVATGLQKNFSWASVAASAVSAGFMGSKWGEGISNCASGFGSQIVQNAITGGAASIVHAATRSLLDGTDFGDAVRASIPDVLGQAIGGEIARGLGPREAPLHKTLPGGAKMIAAPAAEDLDTMNPIAAPLDILRRHASIVRI